MRIHVAWIVFCLLPAGELLAQGGCNGRDHFNDFDFRVGQWDVTNNQNGNVAGQAVPIEAGMPD